MIEPDALVVFLAAAVALIVAPGPDTAFVLSTGLKRSVNSGVLAAVGVSTGVLVHTTAAAFGLSVLFERSPLAYGIVQTVGAAYLAYLGVKTFTTAGSLHTADAPAGNSYLRGVAVNVLNPKVALFFLSFLPQFVTGDEAVTTQFLLLGGIYAGLTALYLGGVALLSNAAQRLLETRPGLIGNVERLTGVLLVTIGVRLLVGVLPI